MNDPDIFSQPGILNDPFEIFSLWFARHSDLCDGEPCIAFLSTAGSDMRVSSRTVLVKEFGPKGFHFYTNYQSRKGIQLLQNPMAALLYFWPELRRQVRIEGIVKKLTVFESESYFNSRPQGSRISAAVSPQSSVIPDRHYLEDLVSGLSEKLKGKGAEKPSWWGGYQLIPDLFEFWQEGENRLHHRLQFIRNENNRWKHNLLAP